MVIEELMNDNSFHKLRMKSVVGDATKATT